MSTIQTIPSGATEDIEELERNTNFIEIPELFSQREDLTEEVVEMLAVAIAEAWRARLQAVYPKRKFSVEVVWPDPETKEDRYGVTFHEIKN